MASFEIKNSQENCECKYSNHILEVLMRRQHEKCYDYKSFAERIAYSIECYERGGAPKDEYYALYIEIYTNKYYKIGQCHYYHFDLGRIYKKRIQELFPVTEEPSLETTIAYKNILETCVYISKNINPNDGVFFLEVRTGISSAIRSIMWSKFSKKIEDNFYLVDMCEMSKDPSLKRDYIAITYAPHVMHLLG